PCDERSSGGEPCDERSSGGERGERDVAVRRRRSAAAQSAGLESQSRKLRNSLISLAVFCGLVIGLLFAVPSLRTVLDRITDAQIGWILAAAGLEVLSCVGYVVLFVFLFERLGWRLGSRLSLAELAVNAVVSVGGLGGIVLGAWVLNSKGASPERVARRSALLFLLTSAVNVCAVLAIGVLMWLGILPGSTNPLLTILPAAMAAGAIAGSIAIAAWTKRFARRIDSYHPRTAIVLRGVADAVWDSVRLLRHPDPRMLGALGYWLFDNLVLYTCLLAFGRAPSFWAVAMAYLVGMLANSLPIPGGFIAVEGGLVGMLVLFGVRDSTALAAVLTYRAMALWIPSIVGSFAFVSIRSEIGQPLQARARAEA
ncbi:MAG: lysylphosphatidylglycerol synthase transmembrane domain-containing protein, partial [Solirubrobacteraceae bacterium]